MPENPSTLIHEDAGNEGDFISAHRARYWGYLFNVRYRMLLTYLTHTFRLSRSVPSDKPSARAAVMHRIFGEMYNLKTISHILVRLPFHDPEDHIKNTDPKYAGPPFEMPYSIRLPHADIDCWRLYLGMFDTTARLSRSLRKGSGEEERRYLAALGDLDRRSRAWIEQMLCGCRSH